MKTEIITIGDELLIGQVENTNASWIARTLNDHGIAVARVTTISDQREDILSAIKQAKERAKLIILTGGLGPTNDDITKYTLCEYFNTTLAVNTDVLNDIKAFLSAKNAVLNERNKKQAEVPVDARIIRNDYGTAPGLLFENKQHIVVALPGVPHEMKNMINKHLIPMLKKDYQASSVYHKTIMTYGAFEAELAEKLNDFENELPAEIKMAYLPSLGYIRLRLSVSGIGRNEGIQLVEKQVDKLNGIIPGYIYGYDNQPLELVLGELLKQNNKTVATAESCTGGAIANLVTSIPGSSAYYKGSVVAYDNSIKASLLMVDPSVIDKHGAVSRPVVEQMVNGAIKRFNADYAIATSGIAGPAGGTPQKPVGTTWIAVGNNTTVHAEQFVFGNRRDRNIAKSAYTGLNMLRKFIKTTL